MDVNVHIQLSGEPHDWIVVRMAAADPVFQPAWIFNADTWALAYPFLYLGATLVRIGRVDRRATREAVFIAFEDSKNGIIVRIRIKRIVQRAADILGDRTFDSHALDEKLVLLVLF